VTEVHVALFHSVMNVIALQQYNTTVLCIYGVHKT